MRRRSRRRRRHRGCNYVAVQSPLSPVAQVALHRRWIGLGWRPERTTLAVLGTRESSGTEPKLKCTEERERLFQLSSSSRAPRNRGDSRCVTTRGFHSRSAAVESRRSTSTAPRSQSRSCLPACLFACLLVLPLVVHVDRIHST